MQVNTEQAYKIVEKILEDLNLQGCGYELEQKENSISGFLGGIEYLSIGFEIDLTDTQDLVQDIFDELYAALDKYPNADAAFDEYYESIDYMTASEFLETCQDDVAHFREAKQKLNLAFINNIISSFQ